MLSSIKYTLKSQCTPRWKFAREFCLLMIFFACLKYLMLLPLTYHCYVSLANEVKLSFEKVWSIKNLFFGTLNFRQNPASLCLSDWPSVTEVLWVKDRTKSVLVHVSCLWWQKWLLSRACQCGSTGSNGPHLVQINKASFASVQLDWFPPAVDLAGCVQTAPWRQTESNFTYFNNMKANKGEDNFFLCQISMLLW